jgi:hypothetical protein
MTHDVPYLGEDLAAYEAAALTLFQKDPPSRMEFSITVHEKGKSGGQGTSTHLWHPAAKSIQEKAKQIAATIVPECKRHAGTVIAYVTLGF